MEVECGVGMQTVSQLLGEDHRTKCMRSKEWGVSVCGVCVCQRRKVMRKRAVDSEAGSFSA